MKLVVKRSTREIEDKGLFGRGKEKLHQKFSLQVQLQDLDESALALLELYTYLSQDGRRRRYTELPITVHTDETIGLPYRVTIPDLRRGVSWTSDYLSKEFADIPYVVAGKMKEILADIRMGKLWNELKHEEIEIKSEEETSESS